MATIYHNPACSTSRKVLAALREAGVEPKVVEYLKTPPDRKTLADLITRAGLTPRTAMRTKGALWQELGLDRPGTTDDAILDAMQAHPVLIERPIVATAKGVRLCRPPEKLAEILGVSTTIPGPDGRPRCRWCAAAPEFFAYHDHEWGFPVGDDRRLFEKLCLEGFQSGLSWRTILAKRENFRAAFAGFDFAHVAVFTEADVARLLQDEGIVRHRGKIQATINNAARALELVAKEGSLAAYIWGFEPAAADLAAPQSATTSAASVALSKDLKKRGWSFVGPTTVFAFMQAMGLINDHAEGCAIRAEAATARAAFRRPMR